MKDSGISRARGTVALKKVRQQNGLYAAAPNEARIMNGRARSSLVNYSTGWTVTVCRFAT